MFRFRRLLLSQAYLVLGMALSGPGAVWVETLQPPVPPAATARAAVGSQGPPEMHERLLTPQLWDPITGRSSGLRDSSCTLREVRCNLLVNITAAAPCLLNKLFCFASFDPWLLLVHNILSFGER